MMIKFLAIFCLVALILYLGWKIWLLAVPQPLPLRSTIATSGSLLQGTYYQVSIPPTKGDDYLSADYRLWIPNGVQTVRGIIIKQHGCGDPAAATGLDHANDLQWQALALKHQFALLGTKLPMGDQPCEYWALTNYGSGKAFLKALNNLAQISNHPELKEIPWALWGHSGGADWVAQMFQEYPERTIAIVCARGGGVPFFGYNPLLVKTPLLFALGENDDLNPSQLLELPKQIFLRYRKRNAPWTLAIQTNTGHETADTRLLAIPYLDAMISERLTKDSNKLRSLDLIQGWLADRVTHTIYPIDKFEDNALQTVWLPNEETARKWQEYVTTGKISPTHKPEAPTNVSAIKISPKEVLITWNFTPDLENGLPSFRIYRNNSLIQTFQGQSHNFGDAADPPDVALEFLDSKATSNSTYTVAAFNKLGESVSQSTQLFQSK